MIKLKDILNEEYNSYWQVKHGDPISKKEILDAAKSKGFHKRFGFFLSGGKRNGVITVEIKPLEGDGSSKIAKTNGSDIAIGKFDNKYYFSYDIEYRKPGGGKMHKKGKIKKLGPLPATPESIVKVFKMVSDETDKWYLKNKQ